MAAIMFRRFVVVLVQTGLLALGCAAGVDPGPSSPYKTWCRWVGIARRISSR